VVITVTTLHGVLLSSTPFSEDLVMDGFLTPRVAPINSKLAMFAMDGDNGDNSMTVVNEAGGSTEITNQDNPSNSLFDSTISNSIVRSPNTTSLRTDLKILELEDVLNPLETKATLKPRSGGDRYTPSFFIMSAELIKPDLCYDYAYQQNGRYFTEENDGSKDPRIVGSLFSNSNINVSLFVKNREDSDFTITDMKTSIRDIDTSQATYVTDTTELTLHGQTARSSVDPESSNDSTIERVPIGPLGGKEGFYLYYDLDPVTYDIDMPLNAYLDYDATFTLPDGTVITLPPYRNQKINSDIPLCANGNFSYAPVFGTFNIQHKDVDTYNIYTQVARRVDNFEVKAFDVNNIDTPINVSTMVAIELIDAGAFHETPTSCKEPDSVLTPRVWVTFENNVSHTDFTSTTLTNAIQNGLVSDQILNKATQMDEPEDFYSKIRRNTAFRISYSTLGDGDTMVRILPGNNGKWRIDNFSDIHQKYPNCVAPVKNPNNNNMTDQTSVACSNNGNNSTLEDIATCMECLYGHNLHYVCSRDNFAIRPEAFKVSLSDDNTSTVNPDFANNTDKSGSTSSPFNLVAGYPYRIDINATSHTDENPVKGYVQKFDSSNARKRAFMGWNGPTTKPNPCNAPDDRNMSFSLIDGTNTNVNPVNTWEDRHDTLINVGEYEFKVVDEEWTKYDWDDNLTQHHNAAHYNTAPDCLNHPTNNSVPALGNKVGCETSSVHTNADGTSYTEVNIQSHPYNFKVSGLSKGTRPSNDSGNTFVYMNTLDKTLYPNGIDENMSYNIQGTFSATSWDNNKPLSNFVDNCYAEDIDMKLLYTHHPMSPADTLNLDYDLIDFNSTDSSVIYRSRENGILDTTTYIIQQGKEYFAKDMKGSITMDLGYNEARTFNAPKNPIYVSMNDFNVTYSVQPTTLYVDGKSNHQIFGNVDIDKNITFVYGRIKPSLFFYDDIDTNSTTTPVSVVLYCDLGLTQCQNRGLANIVNGLLSDAQSNESSWWFSQIHDISAGDGQVTLTTSDGGVSPVDPNGLSLTNGIDKDVTVTNTSGATPAIVNIDLGNSTDRWLIYNPYSSTAMPSPFYKVRFIGNSIWTGVGKTGNVIDISVSTKKSKRLDW